MKGEEQWYTLSVSARLNTWITDENNSDTWEWYKDRHNGTSNIEVREDLFLIIVLKHNRMIRA